MAVNGPVQFVEDAAPARIQPVRGGGGRCGVDLLQLRAVGLQRGQAFSRAGRALIGNVVGAAGKVVDRRNRCAQGRRA